MRIPALTEPVARAVLSALRPAVGAPTGPECVAVVRAWLDARGAVAAGRFGARPVSESERYYTRERVLQHQVRSGGEWRLTASEEYGPLALALLARAAAVVGDAAAAQRAARALAGRERAAQARSSKAAAGALDAGARALAWKHAASDLPAEALAWGRAHTAAGGDASGPPPRPSGPLGDRVAALLPGYRAQMAALDGAVPDDGAFSRTWRPPMLPLHTAGADATWEETEGGVVYTVRVRHRRGGLAQVQLGTPGPSGMALDPVTMAVVRSPEGRGDGVVSAVLSDDGAVLSGVLVYVQAVPRRSGGGSRLLDLWMRLLRGYGVTRWAALAAGTEGLPFLEARARAGAIALEERRGSSFVVRSGPPPEQPLLPGVRPNPGTGALLARLVGALESAAAGRDLGPHAAARLAAQLGAITDAAARLAPWLPPAAREALAALAPEVRRLVAVTRPDSGTSRLDQLHAAGRALLGVLDLARRAAPAHA